MKNNITLILASLIFFVSCKSSKQIYNSAETPTTKSFSKNYNSILIDTKRDLLYDNKTGAIDKLQFIIKNDTLNHVAYYEMAKLELEQKNYVSAEFNAKRAFDIRPGNNSYALLYMYILFNNKKFNEGNKILDRVIKNDENNQELYFQIFEILEEFQQYKKLISVTENFEKKFGYINEIILSKYQFYISSNNVKEAVKYLKSIIERDKLNYLPYQLLGELYFYFNDVDKSFYYYSRANELNNTEPQIYIGLIRCHIYKKRFDDAFKLYEELLTSNSIDLDVKILILFEFFKIEDSLNTIQNADLEKFTDYLLNSYPERADLLVIKGKIYLRKNMLNPAFDYFTKSLKYKPDNIELWNISIYLAEQLKNYDRMITLGDSAIRFYPSNRDFYYFRGYAYYNKGRYQESYDDYKFALLLTGEMDKEKINLLHALAEVSYKLKNVEETFNIYDKILLENPGDVVALNNYAYFLALEKINLEMAKEMSFKTVRAEPKNSTYLDTYAYILFVLKEYKEALKYIEKAILNGGGQNDVILEHYGDILYFNNQVDLAVSAWIEAKERGNGSGKLDLKIQNRKYIDE